jgi:hypothetical protein
LLVKLLRGSPPPEHCQLITNSLLIIHLVKMYSKLLHKKDDMDSDSPQDIQYWPAFVRTLLGCF